MSYEKLVAIFDINTLVLFQMQRYITCSMYIKFLQKNIW